MECSEIKQALEGDERLKREFGHFVNNAIPRQLYESNYEELKALITDFNLFGKILLALYEAYDPVSGNQNWENQYWIDILPKIPSELLPGVVQIAETITRERHETMALLCDFPNKLTEDEIVQYWTKFKPGYDEELEKDRISNEHKSKYSGGERVHCIENNKLKGILSPPSHYAMFTFQVCDDDWNPLEGEKCHGHYQEIEPVKEYTSITSMGQLMNVIKTCE